MFWAEWKAPIEIHPKMKRYYFSYGNMQVCKQKGIFRYLSCVINISDSVEKLPGQATKIDEDSCAWVPDVNSLFRINDIQMFWPSYQVWMWMNELINELIDKWIMKMRIRLSVITNILWNYFFLFNFVFLQRRSGVKLANFLPG